MDREERLARAAELHGRGYNCAQCVLMSFEDITGLDETTAARVASGFGSGIGGCGELCGALAGATMANGMRHGAEPRDKIAAGRSSAGIVRKFAALNGERVRCADLKGKPDVRPCSQLIAQAVELLDEAVSQ